MIALLPLLALASAHADARLPYRTDIRVPSVSSEGRDWRYRCQVEQELKGGTISLTRLYTGDGKPDAGDFMRWIPNQHHRHQKQRPLDLELSYIWHPQSQPAIEPRMIEVRLRVRLDVDLPEVGLIRMQRPFPVAPEASSAAPRYRPRFSPTAVMTCETGMASCRLAIFLPMPKAMMRSAGS